MKIYGPVPSWRLGNSLGVDLVEAPKGYNKICSYDCVYCQLGHTGFKTKVLKPVPIKHKDFLILKKRIEETKPDYITFSGEGEPTLNLNFGYAARCIKQLTNIPLAVLTNASFVHDKRIRQGLNICDLVIAKIDAPNQELFEKINNPYKGILLADIIKGIKLLKTRVAIQTLLFSYDKLTNADNKTIKGLIEVYRDINNTNPINIFLGTAYRPSDKKELNAISENRLKQIALKINQETGIKVNYYKEKQPKTVSRDISPESLEKELFDLLKRRPCTKEDISTRFGRLNVSGILSSLIKKGVLEEKIKGNKKYFFIKQNG